jgi:hypothetical protein
MPAAGVSYSLPSNSTPAGSAGTCQTYPVVGIDLTRTENAPPGPAMSIS